MSHLRHLTPSTDPHIAGGATSGGIAAKLQRAIVVGPIARLELLPLDRAAAGSDDIIEAQMTSQQFHEMGLQEGETLLLTPRKARVFVA